MQVLFYFRVYCIGSKFYQKILFNRILPLHVVHQIHPFKKNFSWSFIEVKYVSLARQSVPILVFRNVLKQQTGFKKNMLALINIFFYLVAIVGLTDFFGDSQEYSCLPNKRVGPNKLVGQKIGQNQIIVQVGMITYDFNISL